MAFRDGKERLPCGTPRRAFPADRYPESHSLLFQPNTIFRNAAFWLAVFGLFGSTAGNDRPLVLDIGPGEFRIGPQATPQKANGIDLVGLGGQDVDMQQERVAVVLPRASKWAGGCEGNKTSPP